MNQFVDADFKRETSNFLLVMSVEVYRKWFFITAGT